MSCLADDRETWPAEQRSVGRFPTQGSYIPAGLALAIPFSPTTYEPPTGTFARGAHSREGQVRAGGGAAGPAYRP
jgi:hypothetical protein